MRSVGFSGRWRSAIYLGVFLPCMLAVRPAGAVRIGVFADPNASSCGLQVPAGVGTTLYVLAILDDAPADGIMGAEFRISGFPGAGQGWFPYVSWTMSSFAIGNPLFEGGYVPFRQCRQSSNRIIELGRINVQLVMTSLTNVVVRVEGHSQPSNADFTCPYVALCDSADACGTGVPQPKFTRVCVEGIESIINGDPCTVDAIDAGHSGVQLRVAPNPAHRGAMLHFEPSRSGTVRIVVYDLAGRQVRDLSQAAAAGRASFL